MSAMAAEVKVKVVVRLRLRPERRPWCLLRRHYRRCSSGCLVSRRIKRAWRVTREMIMVTGGLGDGDIAIRRHHRPHHCHL